jgi:hypothetical protein
MTMFDPGPRRERGIHYGFAFGVGWGIGEGFATGLAHRAFPGEFMTIYVDQVTARRLQAWLIAHDLGDWFGASVGHCRAACAFKDRVKLTGLAYWACARNGERVRDFPWRERR